MATVSLWTFLVVLVILLVPYLVGLNNLLTLCNPSLPISSSLLQSFRASPTTTTLPPTWPLLLRDRHARIVRDLPSSSPLTAPSDTEIPLSQFTYAFGLLMHVPFRLGDVLEMSDSPHSLLDELLTIDQRTLKSLTRWHPLIHAFSAQAGLPDRAPEQGRASPAEALDGVPIQLIGRYCDDLDAVAAYDTVIIHDAVLNSPYRLAFLTKIKQALRPGGRLILTAPISRSGASTRDEPATSPDEPLSLADLEAFLPLVHVDYETDEGFYQRIRDELPHLQWPKEPTPRVFVIATHDAVWANRTRMQEAFHPDFYLTWSTNPLKPWRLAVIDSIFFHHPTARVHVYSDELARDPSPFEVFTAAGFSIEAVPCDYERIFEGTPILPWIRIPAHREKANFISDALRLALVWRGGGVYLDFDAIVLRPVDGLRNVLARELKHGMVNGAILPFDRGHPLLRLLMTLFPRRVHLDGYTSGGPALQSHGMNLYRALLPSKSTHEDVPPPGRGMVEEEEGMLHVYQPPAFFANAWMDADNSLYWLPEHFPAALYEQTKAEQYIFHIWKQMLGATLDSTSNYVHLRSFMGRLFLDNCRVLCQLHRDSYTDPGKVITPPPKKPKILR